MQTNNMDKQIASENAIDYGAYIEEPWSVIGSYFDGKHLDQLVRHQIESYNDFVLNKSTKKYSCPSLALPSVLVLIVTVLLVSEAEKVTGVAFWAT